MKRIIDELGRTCAAANAAGASRLQSLRPVRRVAELGAFGQETESTAIVTAEFSPLDRVVAASLATFESWLLQSNWRGKEHDCVNLFTHGFLFSHVSPQAIIREFTQVGIETGVPQPSHIGIKGACRKDLVIWNNPREVAWDTSTWMPVRAPAAIIEWKAHRRPITPILNQTDIAWLTAYSKHFDGFTGYAVTVDFTSSSRRVATALVRRDEFIEDFHRL